MATVHATAGHHAAAVQDEVVTTALGRKALAVLRIAFGLTFLWAFFDKLLALGYSTGWDPTHEHLDRFGPAAWVNGGHPTEGFLSSVDPDNWFHGVTSSMAGAAWVDWLFMLGILGIGIALTLGAGMRIAVVSGIVLYAMMWAVSFPLVTNPVIDDHLIGLITLAVLGLTRAGDTWGMGRWWARTQVVRQYPILR